jgi:hypothetical protein
MISLGWISRLRRSENDVDAKRREGRDFSLLGMKLPMWWFIAAALFLCITARSGASADTAQVNSMPLNLRTEQGSDFFTFFHLTEVGSPTALDTAHAWHSFRPSGQAFHDLVELDVLVGSDGTISAAFLGLDRSFIDDSRDGVFARDIAKSFLIWAIRKPSPQINSLINNLGDLSGGSGTLIVMRGPAPARPPPDTTGGYGVYLGRDQRVSFTDTGATLAFTNFPGKLPREGMFLFVPGQIPTTPDAGWLRIDVRFGQ